MSTKVACMDKLVIQESSCACPKVSLLDSHKTSDQFNHTVMKITPCFGQKTNRAKPGLNTNGWIMINFAIHCYITKFDLH